MWDLKDFRMYNSILDNSSYILVFYDFGSIHDAGDYTGYGRSSSFMISAFYIVKYSAKVDRQESGRI